MRQRLGSLDRNYGGDERTRLWSPDVASSPPSFNPATYGSDYSWWAARLESYVNGQDVTTLTDRGTGVLTVSAGVGQEPTFHTSADVVSPNGLPFLRWVNGDRLGNAATGITGPYTAAIVCRPTALLGPRVPLIGGTASLATTGLKYSTGNSGSVMLYCGNTPAIQTSTTNPYYGGYGPIVPLGWQVVVGTFHFGNPDQGMVVLKSGLTKGASPNNLISQSGTSGNSNDVAAGGFCVGGQTYVGEIAEAVVWRQTMDDATRVTIGRALADLYGVTY